MTIASTNRQVVAIVQARMGSSRLPGKTLATIEGRSLLAHIVDRTQQASLVDRVVVATTTHPVDAAVIAEAETSGADTFAGSEYDVLDRYYRAATQFNAEIVVRITADDPFKDPDVIDLITSRLLNDPAVDYCSNTVTPTFPEGLDVEAIRFDALGRAWRDANLASEREHVTPYIWKHPELFTIATVQNDVDLSHLRWTLDYEADLVFTREIYARLRQNRRFRMADILRLMENEPTLAQINSGSIRNAGYIKSLNEDPIGD